jgi:amino-acid N-acetyltransferase
MTAFFDTNVLVYCTDTQAPHKQARARSLITQATAQGESVVSTQVLIELFHVLTRKQKMPAATAQSLTMSSVFNFTFVPWFRSVAPYIHKFRNQTFVVGIAGEAIAAGKLQHLAQDLAMIQSMGVKVVLVHGFRPQVNEQLKAKGHAAKYSHGMRITDEVALDCAQEAAGQLRYEIEAAFSQGLPNTPMADSTVRVISGNFITARPVGIVDGVDFQHSRPGAQGGHCRHHARVLDMGAMLLLSPFGFSPTGEAFNLAMEEVATSVATALQADKLIFVTEVPGIRVHAVRARAKTTPSTPSCRWPTPKSCWRITSAQLPTDTAFYLQHCIKACKNGVERSHIIPFSVDGSILLEVYVHDGIGTMVVDEKLESLREATVDDVGGILQLIEPFEKDGTLVKRSRTEIERDVRQLHHHRARRRDLCLRGALPLPRGQNRRNGGAHRIARRAGPG